MSVAPDFPELATHRLLLRELVDADAPELLAIHGDAVRMRWFGSDPLKDLADAQALIRTFAGWRTLANPGTRWALQRHGQAELLGTCGLFGWHRNWRKCMVGYELAAHAQGHGLMREALSAVLDWGFEHMALNRVEALIHPANAASLRLARTLGFVDEGRQREGGHWGGQHHDLLLLALLRRDWPGVQAA